MSSSPSHSSRSDGQASPLDSASVDPAAALQQITNERNSLRSQNDQLWKIIEKQRSIIQNLQKDVAKLSSERDLLRHHLTQQHQHHLLQQQQQQPQPNGNHNRLPKDPSDGSNTTSTGTSLAQVNGHHQQSKRSLERKAQALGTTTDASSQPQSTTVHDELDDRPLAGESLEQDRDTDSISSHTTLPNDNDSLAPPPLQAAVTVAAAPSSNLHRDQDAADAIDNNNNNGSSIQSQQFDEPARPSLSSDNGAEFNANYDPEIQVATTASRIHPQSGSAPSPAIIIDKDSRMIPIRSDSNLTYTGQSHSSAGNSPTASRNVSANLMSGPISPLMPHLPPRSPRRERKDPGDNPASPVASDNEDDTPSQGVRRRGLASTKLSADPTAMSMNDQDQGSAPSPSEYYSSNNTPNLAATPVSRKNISAQIPAIPSSLSSPFATETQGAGALSSSLLNSPAMPMNSTSTPASPIAAIIDQDAEKFRMYMNKLNNPGRKIISAPIQVGGGETNDHAAALGQAVAMENIQTQLELQSQLMGQVQGHGGRIGLNAVHGQNQRPGYNVSAPINIYDGQQQQSTDTANLGRASSEAREQHSLTDLTEKNSSQLSLPSDNRIKRRESAMQLSDEYPKIGARSASQQHRDDDDSASSGHGVMPIPPRRYDSQQQQQSEQLQAGDSGRPPRSASPTPSANSSMANTLASGQPSLTSSRSGPTFHQQAFSMFADNLEFVSVLVVGSNINTNDRGKEQLTFLISIGQEVQGEFDDMFPHDEAQELWRVEKQYSDFVNLDSKLRVTQSRNIVNSLPKLPDKSLFSTHAPSKVDARKRALEQYLQQVTSLRIKDTRDLCEFLSTNVVEREKLREDCEAGRKEGYLTKRGKNFGGWKTRYFILKGPVLEYFDSKDGHHLGSISLTHAQIGRQQSQEKSQDVPGDSSKDTSYDPNSYRHAFLILEPKKGQTVVDAKKNPNNVIRHVLCAETDLERDGWVEALLVHVGKDNADNGEAGASNDRGGRRFPDIQKVSATPIKELQSGKGNDKLLMTQEAYERQQRSIPAAIQGRGASLPQSPTMQGNNPDERPSGELSLTENQQPPNSKGSQPNLPRNPSSQSLPQDEAGNKPSPESQSTSPFLSTSDPAEKRQKSRMTFWPKKATREDVPLPPSAAGNPPSGQNANGSPAAPGTQDTSRIRNFLGKGSSNSSANNTSNGSLNGGISSAPSGPNPGSGSYPSLAPVRQVFGVPLLQAIEQGIVQPGHLLPAVVYRCIEYLNAHKAKLEEGIYRLNGSTAVIKNLKERFNHDGDFPLLAEEEYYDIHAVAGLLKLFLRELPSSVLTRELHKDFLQVIELANRTDRVDELTRLVACLPEENYTLLRALTAHLIEIVDNADINKMTARNVGIVFSPTLGINAGVFALLMSDFDQIFHTHDGRIMPLENSDREEQQQQQQQQQQPILGADAVSPEA
ncbi:hypothetical protein EC991_006432 [Linnemannia zychae]|nr:hypothetical protein EC991_006432 [Linnemannia zychae]